MSDFERVGRAAAAVGERLGPTPDLAVVLGSGLGRFVGRLGESRAVPYREIPSWPVPTAVGHAGALVAGRAGGREVLVLSGRAHYYEGHDRSAVVFSIHVLRRLGVKTVVLTNAAGGINPEFAPGDLMVIDDHINLMGTNPLIGPHDGRFGPRFPDMSEVYSRDLRGVADKAAVATGVDVAHGIYLAVSGPSYETPAEIRAFRTLGADAVGMSTVPEAIVARHTGMDVLGLSCIANLAAGLGPTRLSAEEVVEACEGVAGKTGRFLEAICERI
jgi:purine-nucleoside phosphorylase